MKNTKRILQITDDSRTYKMAKRFFNLKNENKCTKCPPHSGCNLWHSSKPTRSWKHYRKNQWK